MNKPMTTEELAILISEWSKNPSKPRAHFAKLKKQLYSVVQTKEGKSVLRGELKDKWGIDYMAKVYSLKEYHLYNKIELYSCLGLVLTAFNDTKEVDLFGRKTYDSVRAKAILDYVVDTYGVSLEAQTFQAEDFHKRATTIVKFDGNDDAAELPEIDEANKIETEAKPSTEQDLEALQSKNLIINKDLDIDYKPAKTNEAADNDSDSVNQI